MTQPCTIEETEVGKALDLDDAALEAAIGLWSLLEVAEAQPLSTEARVRLSAARSSLDRRLRSLGWDEDFLRKLIAERGEPPERAPGLWRRP
jgi:hypothetical protein